MLSSKFLALTALSFALTTPALASSLTPIAPSATARLSLAHARVGAPMKHASKLDGNGDGLWIIGAVGVVAGVVYAFIQKADDDDEEPASP